MIICKAVKIVLLVTLIIFAALGAAYLFLDPTCQMPEVEFFREASYLA